VARALVHAVTDCVDPDAEPGELDFRFTSGRLCLDLVLTVGERWRRSFERLRSAADLARWLELAGLASPPTRVTAGDLAAMRELRESIFHLARGAMDGRDAAPRDLEVVNAWAARPDLAPTLWRLGARGHRSKARPVPAALATVARDAVELFGGPLAARVRECAASDCSGIFLDESRAGARRWCSMAGCGNRVKVAAYRRRRATAAGVPASSPARHGAAITREERS